MVVLEVAVALVMAEEDVEADEDGPGSGVVREPERADERRDDKPARYRFNKYQNNYWFKQVSQTLPLSSTDKQIRNKWCNVSYPAGWGCESVFW